MSRLLLIVFGDQDRDLAPGFPQAFGMPFDVLVVTGQAPQGTGAERVLVAGLPEVPPSDALVDALVPHVEGYSHLAAVTTMLSRDVLPRLAGTLDVPMVTDVIEVLSPTTFRRPIVAGTLEATVEVATLPMVLSYRPSSFPKPTLRESPAAEQIRLECAGTVERLESRTHAAGRPDLTQADVVVSGGRPLKDAGTFEKVIGGLADALGGAAGATRAAVDNGLAPNELQVGQTGKTVAPGLYLAAGVSGSTQHMAGMKDSKTIVAVNTDPDAPIFEIADLGLVADLFVALPEIQSKVRR